MNYRYVMCMAGCVWLGSAAAASTINARNHFSQIQDVVYALDCHSPTTQIFTYNLDQQHNLYQLVLQNGVPSEKRYISLVEDYGDDGNGQLLTAFEQQGARVYSVLRFTSGEPPSYHVETRWSGEREGARRNFSVIGGRIAQDGRELESKPRIARFSRCAFDAVATIKLYQVYFPDWDYQAEIRRIRRNLADNERRNLAAYTQQQVAARQCQQKISYYQQQCATAGSIADCMQIKGRGQIYWSEGYLAGAAGWRCQ